MMPALLLLATWAVGTLGFFLLAFSQPQHWQLLRKAQLDRSPIWLRSMGWALLGTATLPAILRDGIAFGVLTWAMMLTISACAAVGVIARIKVNERPVSGG